MARWGKCDFKQLVALQKRMERLEKVDCDAFCRGATKELAARLLASVIKQTPVGDYTRNLFIDTENKKIKYASFQKKDGARVSFQVKSVKKGGTLRRGWTSTTEEEAKSGGGKNAKEHANGLQITKTGGTYTISIINPVSYASYVEYGHRTRDHKGFVKGHHMLTKSEQELRAKAPALLEEKLTKFMGECFRG